MSIEVVRGNIFETRAQTIAFGLNAAGRLPVAPVYTHLHDRYPVFVSEYRRLARAGQLPPGALWVWRDGTPWLAALILRETPQGSARPRFVEAALMALYQQGRRAGLRSLALLPGTDALEWPAFEALARQWAPLIDLPLVVYREYDTGTVAAAEPDSPSPGPFSEGL